MLTLFTCCVCWILVLRSFSTVFCTIFRRSFMPPAKAAKGSSSSLFICVAMLWCCLAIASTSPRTVSSDVLSDPDSWDPSAFRVKLRSFLAYSSSMEARAVNLMSVLLALLIGYPEETNRHRKTVVRRMSASLRAFVLVEGQLRHRLCPKNCWQLFG